MDITDYTLKYIICSDEIPINSNSKNFDLFAPLRQRINLIEVNDPRLAHLLCKLIPAQCPFARQIKLLGRTLFTIPPLCKINPLYDELMALRFRAISFLAEEWGEDVRDYC
jgi:hypothetical protein